MTTLWYELIRLNSGRDASITGKAARTVDMVSATSKSIVRE